MFGLHRQEVVQEGIKVDFLHQTSLFTSFLGAGVENTVCHRLLSLAKYFRYIKSNKSLILEGKAFLREKLKEGV